MFKGNCDWGKAIAIVNSFDMGVTGKEVCSLQSKQVTNTNDYIDNYYQ